MIPMYVTLPTTMDLWIGQLAVGFIFALVIFIIFWFFKGFEELGW